MEYLAAIILQFDQLDLPHKVGISVLDIIFFLIGFSFQEGQKLASKIFDVIVTIITVIFYPLIGMGLLLRPPNGQLKHTCFFMFTLVTFVVFAILVGSPSRLRR